MAIQKQNMGFMNVYDGYITKESWLLVLNETT